MCSSRIAQLTSNDIQPPATRDGEFHNQILHGPLWSVSCAWTDGLLEGLLPPLPWRLSLHCNNGLHETLTVSKAFLARMPFCHINECNFASRAAGFKLTLNSNLWVNLSCSLCVWTPIQMSSYELNTIIEKNRYILYSKTDNVICGLIQLHFI